LYGLYTGDGTDKFEPVDVGAPIAVAALVRDHYSGEFTSLQFPTEAHDGEKAKMWSYDVKANPPQARFYYEGESNFFESATGFCSVVTGQENGYFSNLNQHQFPGFAPDDRDTTCEGEMALLWTHQAAGPSTVPPSTLTDYPEFNGTPTFPQDSLAFIPSEAGTLDCLDLRTGALLWSFQNPSREPIRSTPSHDVPGVPIGGPAGWVRRASAIKQEGLVAPAATEEFSLELDEATGFTFTWSIADDELRGQVVIARGNCYVGLGFNAEAGLMDGSDYLLARRAEGGELGVVRATPPATGERTPVESADQGPILSSEMTATMDSTTFSFVRALDPGAEGALDLSSFQDGIYLIHASCEAPNTATSLEVANHGASRGGTFVNLFTGAVTTPAPTPAPVQKFQLYFGTEDGIVFAVEPFTGSLQWSYQSSSAIRSSIVVDPAGSLFVLGVSGLITILDVNGTLLSTYQHPHEVHGDAVVSGHGELVFADEVGTLNVLSFGCPSGTFAGCDTACPLAHNSPVSFCATNCKARCDDFVGINISNDGNGSVAVNVIAVVFGGVAMALLTIVAVRRYRRNRGGVSHELLLGPDDGQSFESVELAVHPSPNAGQKPLPSGAFEGVAEV
jgi:outer membrane protein assembly factor BamB